MLAGQWGGRRLARVCRQRARVQNRGRRKRLGPGAGRLGRARLRGRDAARGLRLVQSRAWREAVGLGQVLGGRLLGCRQRGRSHRLGLDRVLKAKGLQVLVVVVIIIVIAAAAAAAANTSAMASAMAGTVASARATANARAA